MAPFMHGFSTAAGSTVVVAGSAGFGASLTSVVDNARTSLDGPRGSALGRFNVEAFNCLPVSPLVPADLAGAGLRSHAPKALALNLASG